MAIWVAVLSHPGVVTMPEDRDRKRAKTFTLMDCPYIKTYYKSFLTLLPILSITDDWLCPQCSRIYNNSYKLYCPKYPPFLLSSKITENYFFGKPKQATKLPEF